MCEGHETDNNNQSNYVLDMRSLSDILSVVASVA
jgi:hypothetical protein